MTAVVPFPPAPLLATAATLPTNPSGYAFEAKWDGIRGLARVDGNAELFSRPANNLTPCFLEITEQLADALEGRTAILDGETVALDRHGRPSFELIQRRMRNTRPPAHLVTAVPAIFFIFDVLYLDGTRRDAPARPRPSWTPCRSEPNLQARSDIASSGQTSARRRCST